MQIRSRRPITHVVAPIAILALVLAGLVWLLRPAQPAAVSASLTVSEAFAGPDIEGFQRATTPRPFHFPADHGPHPNYQTEWWYYTGNLQSEDGRQWGYQLTFFRRGITPTLDDRPSTWATNSIYMAHFALTDVMGQQFFADERYARGGDLGLAGATADPYHVFVQDWSAQGTGETATLRANSDRIAIDLDLRSLKPPTLQGEEGNGLSQKSSQEGNASFYYSLSRMATNGTITLDNTSYSVNGLSWMDHEWGTSALGGEQVGWDWFGLQLDDGREIMWGQLRRADGSLDVAHGSLSAVDGTQTQLQQDDVTITVQETWTSPSTGVRYPSRWRIAIPKHDLLLDVQPRLADQELRLSIFAYWEGSVQISGSVDGRGYVELTGYDPGSKSQR